MRGNMLTLPPTWIEHDLLKKVLAARDPNIEITSWTTENVTELSDYSSNKVYRILVEILRLGQKEHRSIIIKASDEEVSKINSAEKSFTREMEAYAVILPQMARLLECTYRPFSPKCFYNQRDSPVTAIVLEDLNSQGFKHPMSPSLDMKHCIVVIRKIAQYHAASAVLRSKNPSIKNSFRTSIYSSESKSSLSKIIPPILKKIAEEVATWPRYKENFSDRLLKLADIAVDNINDAVRTNEGDFIVLSHEDLSLNNIMFQYSTDSWRREIADARFLDFQSVHWATPGIDFYRFLHSCADPDVLEWSQIMVEEYYFILEETLSALGCRFLCPTIAYIYKNFQKCVLFGLILGLVDRVIRLHDDNEIEDCKDKEDRYSRVQLNERSKMMLKGLLLAYQQKGWLQHLE